MVTAYCVKCKAKGVTMKDPVIHVTEKGGYMAKGVHEACGTTLCAMISKENAEAAIASGEARKEAA
ncbi:hypothetical protein JXB02_05750 [Candidatus Woesearchaeota archaeon]|nr:hypothetical protein [Candidatus Woesearchaeota archaeon]